MPFADSQPGDALVRGHRQATLAHEPAELRAGLALAKGRRAERARAEHDILKNRQAVGERKVLVHHPDPSLQGSLRGPSGECLETAIRSGDLNGPLIGDIVAEQDVHQRRLSGSVLSQQSQNLSLVDVEVDGLVGDERTKALRHPCNGQNNRRRLHGYSRWRQLVCRSSAAQLDLGSASFTLTRNRPSTISFSLSLTSFATSGVTRASSRARLAPP